MKARATLLFLLMFSIPCNGVKEKIPPNHISVDISKCGEKTKGRMREIVRTERRQAIRRKQAWMLGSLCCAKLTCIGLIVAAIYLFRE